MPWDLVRARPNRRSPCRKMHVHQLQRITIICSSRDCTVSSHSIPHPLSLHTRTEWLAMFQPIELAFQMEESSTRCWPLSQCRVRRQVQHKPHRTLHALPQLGRHSSGRLREIALQHSSWVRDNRCALSGCAGLERIVVQGVSQLIEQEFDCKCRRRRWWLRSKLRRIRCAWTWYAFV